MTDLLSTGRLTSKGNPPHSLNMRTNTLIALEVVSPSAAVARTNSSFSSTLSFVLSDVIVVAMAPPLGVSMQAMVLQSITFMPR